MIFSSSDRHTGMLVTHYLFQIYSNLTLIKKHTQHNLKFHFYQFYWTTAFNTFIKIKNNFKVNPTLTWLYGSYGHDDIGLIFKHII